MKKIFIVLCCIGVLTFSISIPCFAAEVDGAVSEEPPITSDAAVEESVVEASPVHLEDTDTHTLFTRLWEFIGTYKTEVLTVSGDTALVVFAICMKIKNSKGNKEIKGSLNAISKNTGVNVTNINELINAVNVLIESYNNNSISNMNMQEAYEKYGATELDRNKVIGALAAEVATVLEILNAVFVHNKNLPQGIKDFITVKYANCLKALENDSELASVVKAVRNTLGIVTAENSEETVAPEKAEA